jgi:peptidoglycan hydrolase-like protein with peptidoglycan-binding domain
MKNYLINLFVAFVFVMPQVSAESLFDKIKRKADEIIAEQEAKADQKIDQTIDETVDSAEQAVYEGDNAGSNTSSGTSAGNSASTKQPAATGDNANAMLVKMTQTELKRLGYPVSVDGVYGPGTRNAILAYEADSGRQLTGNVSPELVNALKGTSKSGSTGKSTTKTNQTSSQVAIGEASKREKAQKLLSECQAKADNSGVFYYCLNTCNQVLSAPSEAVGTYLYQCEASHKAAFQQAAQKANASTTPVPQAASVDPAWLATSATEMRQKQVECQGKIDAIGDPKNNGRKCVNYCKNYAERFEKNQASSSGTAKLHLDRCRGFHKRWMET